MNGISSQNNIQRWRVPFKSFEATVKKIFLSLCATVFLEYCCSPGRFWTANCQFLVHISWCSGPSASESPIWSKQDRSHVMCTLNVENIYKKSTWIHALTRSSPTVSIKAIIIEISLELQVPLNKVNYYWNFTDNIHLKSVKSMEVITRQWPHTHTHTHNTTQHNTTQHNTTQHNTYNSPVLQTAPFHKHCCYFYHIPKSSWDLKWA